MDAFIGTISSGLRVTVQYELTSGQHGIFRIFNQQGRLVHRQEVTGTGRQGTLAWDGADLTGKKSPSGLYIGRLESPGMKTRWLRLVLAR